MFQIDLRTEKKICDSSNLLSQPTSSTASNRGLASSVGFFLLACPSVLCFEWGYRQTYEAHGLHAFTARCFYYFGTLKLRFL